MQSRRTIFLTVALVMLPIVGHAQRNCVAPALSDQRVQEIVSKQRAARSDLPKPFPRHRSLVKRQGCYYIYIEYGLPEAPEYNQIFLLNQFGAIVDAQTSGSQSIKCPEKVLTEAELAEVIKKERARRQDLPAPFPRYKTRVDRLRCLYLYFEYALPETKGNYRVFTIDPFGELVESSQR